MVHAINKDGIEREFQDRVWALMPKGKNGWMEYNALKLGEVLIPQQVVEFQQSLKKDAVVEENVETPKVVERTIEIPIVEPQTIEDSIVEKKTKPVKKANVVKTKKQAKR